MNILVLTWRDKQYELHSKEYTDPKAVAEARRWLAKHGAYDIDVAIRIEKVA